MHKRSCLIDIQKQDNQKTAIHYRMDLEGSPITSSSCQLHLLIHGAPSKDNFGV